WLRRGLSKDHEEQQKFPVRGVLSVEPVILEGCLDETVHLRQRQYLCQLLFRRNAALLPMDHEPPTELGQPFGALDALHGAAGGGGPIAAPAGAGLLQKSAHASISLRRRSNRSPRA